MKFKKKSFFDIISFWGCFVAALAGVGAGGVPTGTGQVLPGGAAFGGELLNHFIVFVCQLMRLFLYFARNKCCVIKCLSQTLCFLLTVGGVKPPKYGEIH